MPATPLDTKPAPSAPSHEETLRQAWERYGSFIYITCGVIALGILAKGGWDYLNVQKEIGIQNEYSQCVSLDSYRSFAANHPGHPLAGAAEVIVADGSYATGKFADAVTSYTSAIADLPAGPGPGARQAGPGDVARPFGQDRGRRVEPEAAPERHDTPQSGPLRGGIPPGEHGGRRRPRRRRPEVRGAGDADRRHESRLPSAPSRSGPR
jgi:hypothetical protein